MKRSCQNLTGLIVICGTGMVKFKSGTEKMWKPGFLFGCHLQVDHNTCQIHGIFGGIDVQAASAILNNNRDQGDPFVGPFQSSRITASTLPLHQPIQQAYLIITDCIQPDCPTWPGPSMHIARQPEPRQPSTKQCIPPDWTHLPVGPTTPPCPSRSDHKARQPPPAVGAQPHHGPRPVGAYSPSVSDCPRRPSAHTSPPHSPRPVGHGLLRPPPAVGAYRPSGPFWVPGPSVHAMTSWSKLRRQTKEAASSFCPFAAVESLLVAKISIGERRCCGV